MGDRQFDHPDIVTAYTNHCLRMIDLFEPDYMTYGSESNLLGAIGEDARQGYVAFNEKVYAALKREHPDLPLCLSFQADIFHVAREAQEKVCRDLLPYTDVVVASSYPHMFNRDPREIPEDWFEAVADLDRTKPFAIGETGCIARPMPASDSVGNYETPDENSFARCWPHGSDEVQVGYVTRLLADADRLGARFVNWYFARDHDSAWDRMADHPKSQKMALAWRNSGLADEAGRPRPAMDVWDQWLSRPYSGSGAKA